MAFFVLAVQLFITVLEFKLTTLAGFVLVPFALWNKTAFLAERVLGNVISSGIKVMVLTAIVGIGNRLFTSFTAAPPGQTPTLAGAMSPVLAALTLLGLGIFGPAIATGLVSGAPQLGAGAALGAAGVAAGSVMLTGGAVVGGVRLLGTVGFAAIRAGTTVGTAARTAYGLGQATSGASGMAGVAAGLGGVARAGGGAAANRVRTVVQRASTSLSESAEAGRRAAWQATGGANDLGLQPIPGWRRTTWCRRHPCLGAALACRTTRPSTTAQAIKEGDCPGAPANPNLDEEE